MALNVAKEVAALGRMTVKQLRERYAEVFGEATAGNNRTWLVRRIAWRLQAAAEGDLTERAKARAAELARDADLRLSPPAERAAARTATGPVPPESDARLPPPGTILTRPYKGRTIQVRVLADGFEYAGEVYASLSAVAKAVTGSHCNGFLFFRLTGGAA
ncbi:MAG: putative bacteriophage related protein [Gemmataceae bacterium]|nr:putative bacteriophage related protein [Gemmataceae bacterium]